MGHTQREACYFTGDTTCCNSTCRRAEYHQCTELVCCVLQHSENPQQIYGTPDDCGTALNKQWKLQGMERSDGAIVHKLVQRSLQGGWSGHRRIHARQHGHLCCARQ